MTTIIQIKKLTNMWESSLTRKWREMTTNNLVIQNNSYNSSETPNIVYQFKRTFWNDIYIGVTRMSMRKRLYQHSYNCSIKSHYQIKHNKKTRKGWTISKYRNITQRKRLPETAYKRMSSHTKRKAANQ